MLYTPDSKLGTPYPRLGRVLERFADLLRLKAVLREDPPEGFASWKTVQRLFAGDPVSDEVLTSVVTTLLDGLVPSAGLPTDLASAGATAAKRVRTLIVDQLVAYEHYATEVAAGQFPLMRPELAAYPYLRLLAFDLGLRYGAWAGLSARRGHPLPARPAWLARDAFAKELEATRAKAGLTQEELAARCEVSVTTVKKWKSGTLPENRHIEALAKVLHGEAARALVELHLRLSALAQGLLVELEPNADEAWWVRDLLSAFEITAGLVREELERPVVPEHADFDTRIYRVIDEGPHAPLGANLCELLAHRALAAMKQEVHLDFLALPGSRVGRIGYWAKLLAPPEGLRAYIEASSELPKDLAQYAEYAWIPAAAIGPFDQELDPDRKLVRIKGPAWYSRNNRLTQAEQAASVGDLEGAVAHLRRAIELVPADTAAHAYLGAFLGQIAKRDGRLDLLDEALTELHVAVQLAPAEKMPAHEIGVVLGNCGRHAEAEDAFARAESLCMGWALFHQNRGWNLLALQRLDDAYVSYRRAIDLEPDLVASRVRLVAICMATGREREAATHALRVRHLTHDDPMPTWRQWLDPRAKW